jgi:hypothetical protein
MGMNASPPAEQRTYARWLGWCTRAALAVLMATFVAYLLRLSPPLVSLQVLPEVWGLPVDRYIAAVGAPTGWSWLGRIGNGDYANVLGIAMLCLVTVVCYLRLLPMLVRSGERLLAAIALAQVLVLIAAASGWLSASH